MRAIRETWGADSGTNVIRRETFYRDEMKQKTFLRVHVIPPLDGIYAQWDFNAGQVKTFSNSRGSHAIDGKNDEAYGNFDDPCNPNFDANETSDVDQGYRDVLRADAALQLALPPVRRPAGPDVRRPERGHRLEHGRRAERLDRRPHHRRREGPDRRAARRSRSLAVPYYRDDSCFDDGTGSDPGPDLGKRKDPEPRTTRRRHAAQVLDAGGRACRTGTDRFFQGSIATHGVHLLILAESDNARQTVPVNEIVNEWQMVMLPGERPATDGERYGRAFEKPLVTTVSDVGAPPAAPRRSRSRAARRGAAVAGSSNATPPAHRSRRTARSPRRRDDQDGQAKRARRARARSRADGEVQAREGVRQALQGQGEEAGRSSARSPRVPRMDYDAIRGGLQQAVPFNPHLGLEIAEVGQGVGVVKLPDRSELRNHVGSQHAGALFAAGEAASGAAFVGTFAERLERHHAARARRAEIAYRSAPRAPSRPPAGSAPSRTSCSPTSTTTGGRLRRRRPARRTPTATPSPRCRCTGT